MVNPYTHAAPNNRVYYLGADSLLGRDLGSLLNQKGLKLKTFESPDQLVSAAGQAAPAVLILELDRLPPHSTLEHFVTALIGVGADRPELICIAVAEDIETRLQAVRAGAQGVFVAPVAAADLAQKVIQISGIAGATQHRVLVVEDDPAQAKYIALLLSNSGFEPRVLSQPLKVLEAIREFRPDLVLMDLYMPEANGDELTAVIRDQDEFFDLPIIFLSSERDLDKQMDALRLGGDSFIAKPVQRKLLCESIDHRIRMTRWLRERRQAVNRRDAATGLLQKDHFMRQLDRCVRSPVPLGEGCGLLQIEIDSPHETLDRLGLDGTERLLRQLEIRLSNHMTPEESAARLGDFSYALLARRDDTQGLVELAERLRGALVDPVSNGAGASDDPAGASAAVTTLSIGIALFTPAADDAVTMISRGQKAAMAARFDGGDRVRCWAPVVAPGASADGESQIRALLEQAINNQGLMLLFQPIVSLGQESGEFYEAQLRLCAPDGEHIPPQDFLPVAERCALMPTIDRWVIKRALDVIDIQRVVHPRLRLLVHQTVASVAAAHWLPWFRDQIVQRNLVRLRPLLEFQLADVRADLETAKSLIANLRKYGVQVCIANCSGSPADVQLLAELEANLAKLSFHTLTNTEQGELTAIVRALRDNAIAVIAAGIEDPETVARVWNCRPDFLQGSYLQLPSADLSFDFTKPDYVQ
ncbi:EAL domain-containing protein [uncultured Thiodictyon sp.]|uniref:EAL domain-containing protein n=1 Tax=uncultured Thiodictyon sp. TaxID=1846217 RepID=UPI0025EE2BE7|nr:EAL domain-containing protein [uncultured Thiodictyon sp.]